MALVVKNLPAKAGDMKDAGSILGWGDRRWQPTPVCWPGKSCRQKSLTGYGPWGGKESDTAEVTQHMQVPRSEGQHGQGSLQPILA